MKVNDSEVKEGLYYTKEHEWVKVEGKLARVGVTDYAQKQLGDVVYVELPAEGKIVQQVKDAKKKEMELGALESIKAVSAVYSPISGKVKEANKALVDKPELINTSPYEDGWICIIEPSDLDSELKNLLDASKYAEYIKNL
ncbi:MAG: glycine cleavage system protein H [Hadesarchaea archaeon YNP_N21]|jgi:glycine cleavage system H protein|nr:MAG: glycine cleavage system protein H [Hadesarchaea archaeon YNP_N21]